MSGGTESRHAVDFDFDSFIRPSLTSSSSITYTYPPRYATSADSILLSPPLIRVPLTFVVTVVVNPCTLSSFPILFSCHGSHRLLPTYIEVVVALSRFLD